MRSLNHCLNTFIFVERPVHNRTMSDSNFIDYLERVTGRTSRRGIAEKSGIPPSTFVGTMRKVEDGLVKMPMEHIVAICRAFGTPLLPALIAAGYITQEEADDIVSGSDLDLYQLTNDQLGRETLRRLTAGNSG